MPKTSIKITNVINASSKGTSAQNKISAAKTGVEVTRRAIDSKILNRNNINSRLSGVKDDIAEIEKDIAKICAAINNGALKYQMTENLVVSYGNELENLYTIEASSAQVGKYDAFFANVSLKDRTLKASGGILSYAQGDSKFIWGGIEYENELFHLHDKKELSLFGTKFETGKSEQYWGKLSLTKEYSNKPSLEFDMDKAEKKLNKMLKANDEKQKQLENEKKEGYYDLEGKKIDKKDAPTFYERKATIGEIDKTVGVSASVYEGTFSTGREDSKVSITVAKAEAHVSVSGGLYVIGEKGDRKFSPGVKAEVGTSVTALELEWDQQWLGNENLGLNTNVTATVGKAEAKADVTAQVFNDKGKLDVQLGASASAELIGGEIEESVGVNVLGGEIGVTGGINYGIGAHADVGYRNGVLKVDVGASLGLGLSLDVEVDVGGMIDTTIDAVCDGIEAVADKAESAWNGIKDGWNDFWNRW